MAGFEFFEAIPDVGAHGLSKTEALLDHIRPQSAFSSSFTLSPLPIFGREATVS